MKITIVLDDGSRYVAKLPYEGAPHCEVKLPLAKACDCAKAEARKASARGPDVQAELFISGTGIKHQNHDTVFADAIALCCKRKIGTIETKLATLFGIEEDERVMSTPGWKVF